MGKNCAKCGEWKPLDGFHKQPSGPQGRHSYCKECANALQRGVRKRNFSPEQKYINNLWTRYRLRPADYEVLLQSQNGLCAICGTPPSRPVVDHCHETGRVRGILCHPCNIALPFAEKRDWLDRAHRYLGQAR